MRIDQSKVSLHILGRTCCGKDNKYLSNLIQIVEEFDEGGLNVWSV